MHFDEDEFRLLSEALGIARAKWASDEYNARNQADARLLAERKWESGGKLYDRIRQALRPHRQRDRHRILNGGHNNG